jgi:hypothetical protein
MVNASPKAMMESVGYKDPKMTTRYTHLSMDYNPGAVSKASALQQKAFGFTANFATEGLKESGSLH